MDKLPDSLAIWGGLFIFVGFIIFIGGDNISALGIKIKKGVPRKFGTLSFLIGFGLLGIDVTMQQHSPTPSQTNTVQPSIAPLQTAATSLNTVFATETPCKVCAIVVQRSPDTIVVHTLQPADLSKLQILIGTNEEYTLGNLFPSSTESPENKYWCIRETDAYTLNPDVCTKDNTSFQQGTVDWRNSIIKLFLNNTLLNTCPPQPDNLTLYSCTSR